MRPLQNFDALEVHNDPTPLNRERDGGLIEIEADGGSAPQADVAEADAAKGIDRRAHVGVGIAEARRDLGQVADVLHPRAHKLFTGHSRDRHGHGVGVFLPLLSGDNDLWDQKARVGCALLGLGCRTHQRRGGNTRHDRRLQGDGGGFPVCTKGLKQHG